MGSSWGNSLKISIFGESHGLAIGIVVDGFPHGIELNSDEIQFQLSRRAPGKNNYSTPRKESDTPEILSGVLNGKSTGAPICAVFKNSDTRSADYSNIMDIPRPSHADWAAFLRYAGNNDIRGGGHFSGRLTAPLLFAGSLAKTALEQHGISIAARIKQIGTEVDPQSINDIDKKVMLELQQKEFPVVSETAKNKMLECIDMALTEGDSVGGVVEVIAYGVPAGWGNPMLDTVEGRLAYLLFGVPAVKGIEFGAGFALATMKGSQANDPFLATNPVTMSNNNAGGINGGITNGMPLVFRAVIRPTSSISKQQDSFSIRTGKPEKLTIQGRHDPCIVPRVLPVLEAATALVMLDLCLDMEGRRWI